MEFRVLGPLEVRNAAGELELGRGEQRALLAVLLIHAGDAVPADRLIDALWGESPPQSALNSVHIYVSQLRRTLGQGRLVTRRGGYALEVAPGELDAERFEQLLADGGDRLRDGDPVRAGARLREALALWRGSPLADFTYEAFAQPEIARLEELRLEAFEERVEADLRLGRHRELVSELQAAVRAHPLRERLRAQLMLALYRCGRQAEALETYQQARRMLAEELGLAPGPTLQRLERAVLRQDPQLAAAEPIPKMRVARPRGSLYLLLGGVALLAVAATAFLLLRGESSVVSVAPDSVAVVEGTTGDVTAGVPIGAGPSAVAVGAGALWVATGDNSVSRIDLDTRSVRQTIQVGGAPADVAVSNGAAWVANGIDGTVSRIDVESSRVVETIAVGNGPTGYRVAEFRPRTHTLRPSRNPSFNEWAPDARPDGYPDAISWSWFRNEAAAVRAVEHGSADIAVDLDYTLPKPDFDRLATRLPARLHMSPRPHTGYFFLNTRIPPFDDPRLRRAVNDAFDRAAFARIAGPVFAPTCQILPPNLPAYRPTCPYRGGVAGLDAARRRVRRSRTSGANVTVWVPTQFAEHGRYMVSLLHAIGYRARLKVLPLRSYFTSVLDSRSRAQVGYWGWAAEFPSPIDVVQPVFGCAGFVPAAPLLSHDPSGFCDHRIDAQMKRAAALQAEDPSAANVMWQRVEREILARAPMVPTTNRRSVDFVAPRVGHYEYNPQWGVLLDRLWVR